MRVDELVSLAAAAKEGRPAVLSQSIPLMTVFDLAFLGAAIYAGVTFFRVRPQITTVKARVGFSAIIFGLSLVALFYMADLVIMHVFPFFTPMTQAMEIMSNLHLNHRWWVSLTAICAIAMGCTSAIKDLLLLIQRQKRSQEELEIELASRHQTERALRKSQDDLKKAQKLGKIGNWRWSITRNELISCSEEFASIHGVDLDQIHELMAHEMERVIHPDDRARVAAEYKRFDEDGVDFEIEYRIIRADGAVRNVFEIGGAIFDDLGFPVEQMGILQDITELKAAQQVALMSQEEAAQANRAKAEFLATMSHELRTPLNAIIGFSQMIRDNLFEHENQAMYREYAKDINLSGQHLLSLINDILDISKIESGTEELLDDRVDVPTLIRSVEALVKHRAEQGGINLKREIPPDLPGLEADERKLKQILVNLLTNAIKFTEPGGVVTLKAWYRWDSGFVFQVTDTGIGIAPRDIPKVLSQFGQVDSPLSRKHSGTGLGLPLSKSLTELHGGSLDLQSQPGNGTTVTVRLPARRIVNALCMPIAEVQTEWAAG